MEAKGGLPFVLSDFHCGLCRFPNKDPVDRFQLLIPFLTCVPFPIFY